MRQGAELSAQNAFVLTVSLIREECLWTVPQLRLEFVRTQKQSRNGKKKWVAPSRLYVLKTKKNKVSQIRLVPIFFPYSSQLRLEFARTQKQRRNRKKKRVAHPPLCEENKKNKVSQIRLSPIFFPYFSQLRLEFVRTQKQRRNGKKRCFPSACMFRKHKKHSVANPPFSHCFFVFGMHRLFFCFSVVFKSRRSSDAGFQKVPMQWRHEEAGGESPKNRGGWEKNVGGKVFCWQKGLVCLPPSWVITNRSFWTHRWNDIGSFFHQKKWNESTTFQSQLHASTLAVFWDKMAVSMHFFPYLLVRVSAKSAKVRVAKS